MTVIPDFLRRPEHPLTHNLAAVALRYSVRMGLAADDTTPMLLAGEPLTISVALQWAEKLAAEVLA